MKAAETISQEPIRTFLGVPAAAELAGFSIRHFRRIIEEGRIPVIEIRRKFFILGNDFNTQKTIQKKRRH